MTSAPRSSIYCGPASVALAITPLDSLSAVYDRRSGITHLVAEPVPAILAELSGVEGDLAYIMARLSERFDVDGGTDVLAERLEELVALGLVKALAG